MLSGRNHKTPIGAFHAASAAGEGNPASHATKIISTSSRFDQTAAVFGDTSRLAHGIAPQQVARAPLWRAEGAPREVLNSSRDRAVMLLVNGAHWHVWNDWYNYVRGAQGRAPNGVMIGRLPLSTYPTRYRGPPVRRL